MSVCVAAVSESAVEIRSWRTGDTDERCLRPAKTSRAQRPLCYQHARLAEREAQTIFCRGHKANAYPIGEGWFCSRCRKAVKSLVV